MIRLVQLLLLAFFAQCVLADTELDQAISKYEGGNYSSAFRAFSRLARSGNHLAQFNLGAMYYRGQGVEQDVVQAYAWIALSSQDGDVERSRLSDRIYRAMSDEQKKQAVGARRELFGSLSDGALGNADATVVLGTQAVGLGTALVFARMDSDDRFSVRLNFSKPNEVHILHVPPGRYYVRALGSLSSNLIPVNPQPDDISNTVLIRPGLVNYIGDWKVSEWRKNEGNTRRFDAVADYSRETLLKAVADAPELASSPLVISRPGAPMMPLSWN